MGKHRAIEKKIVKHNVVPDIDIEKQFGKMKINQVIELVIGSIETRNIYIKQLRRASRLQECAVTKRMITHYKKNIKTLDNTIDHGAIRLCKIAEKYLKIITEQKVKKK